ESHFGQNFRKPSLIRFFPYSDDRELLTDILKHGAEVEVLEPPALLARVAGAHAEAARCNRGGSARDSDVLLLFRRLTW
ncbi:MAG TPA: hypothetical protein VGB36_03710, partial [Gammaproteobacteria bacterium]